MGLHAVSTAIARTAAPRREGGKVGRALERRTSTFKGDPHIGCALITGVSTQPRLRAVGRTWEQPRRGTSPRREAQVTRAKKKWSPRPRAALMPPMPRHNEGDNIFTSS